MDEYVFNKLVKEQRLQLFDVAANPVFKTLLNLCIQEMNNRLIGLTSGDQSDSEFRKTYELIIRERSVYEQELEFFKNIYHEFKE